MISAAASNSARTPSTVPVSPGGLYHDDKTGSYFGARDIDTKSDAGVSAINGGDMFRNLETREHMAEKGNEAKLETVEEHPVSGSRKRWLFFVWALTWYIPTPFIRVGGGFKGRKDMKTAWREKLAINILIWLSCAFVIFFMSKFSFSSRRASLTSISWFPGVDLSQARRILAG